MQKILRVHLLVAILLSGVIVRGQDAIDKIATGCCECLNGLDTSMSIKDREAQLGICMIKCSAPYKKELKNKYGIDLDVPKEDTWEKLGKMLGMKMVIDCPTELIKFSGDMSKDKKTTGRQSSTSSDEREELMVGNVVDITTGQFATVLFKEINGREQKLLWLEYFTNAELLAGDIAKLKNRELKVYYIEKEFYNPQLKDYIKYKIITKVAYN